MKQTTVPAYLELTFITPSPYPTLARRFLNGPVCSYLVLQNRWVPSVVALWCGQGPSQQCGRGGPVAGSRPKRLMCSEAAPASRMRRRLLCSWCCGKDHSWREVQGKMEKGRTQNHAYKLGSQDSWRLVSENSNPNLLEPSRGICGPL